MQNTYELMIAYKPILFDDLKNGTIAKIEKLVGELKGTLTQIENHGKNILAYDINGVREGHYVEYDLSLDSNAVNEFSKELHLIQDVLRFLIIKK